MKDPYDDSKSEMERLARLGDAATQELRDAVSTSIASSATEQALKKLSENVASQEDELALLREMIVAMKTRTKGGRLAPIELVLERERFVETMAEKVAKIHQLINVTVDRRKKSISQAVAIAPNDVPQEIVSTSAVRERLRDAPDDSNDFIKNQMHQQELMEMEQQQSLDVLHHGVVGLREKAKTIGGELNDQEKMLTAVDTKVSGVQDRLSQATKRVNDLLDSMSDRGKICCILLLVFVLGILAAVVITG